MESGKYKWLFFTFFFWKEKAGAEQTILSCKLVCLEM
jgi:hypothetical protein